MSSSVLRYTLNVIGHDSIARNLTFGNWSRNVARVDAGVTLSVTPLAPLGLCMLIECGGIVFLYISSPISVMRFRKSSEFSTDDGGVESDINNKENYIFLVGGVSISKRGRPKKGYKHLKKVNQNE